MTHTETSPSDWQECKPGTLVGYATRDVSRKRRRRIAKVIGVSSAFALAVFVSLNLMQSVDSSREPNYGGIVCSKVMANSGSFLAGNLDPEMNSKIQEHIKNCPSCRSGIGLLKKSQVSVNHNDNYFRNTDWWKSFVNCRVRVSLRDQGCL